MWSREESPERRRRGMGWTLLEEKDEERPLGESNAGLLVTLAGRIPGEGESRNRELGAGWAEEQTAQGVYDCQHHSVAVWHRKAGKTGA